MSVVGAYKSPAHPPFSSRARSGSARGSGRVLVLPEGIGQRHPAGVCGAHGARVMRIVIADDWRPRGFPIQFRLPSQPWRGSAQQSACGPPPSSRASHSQVWSDNHLGDPALADPGLITISGRPSSHAINRLPAILLAADYCGTSGPGGRGLVSLVAPRSVRASPGWAMSILLHHCLKLR